MCIDNDVTVMAHASGNDVVMMVYVMCIGYTCRSQWMRAGTWMSEVSINYKVLETTPQH